MTFIQSDIKETTDKLRLPAPAKINMLWMSDHVAHTGYATVAKNLVPLIKKEMRGKLRMDIVAINYFGDMFEEDGSTVISAIKTLPVEVQEEIFRNNPEKKMTDKIVDDFGRIGFADILQRSAFPHPDDLPGEKGYNAIFILNDVGVILPFVPVLKSVKQKLKDNNLSQFKSIFYFPVDCDFIDIHVKEMEFFDAFVSYTEYGRKQVLKLRPELKSKLFVVPHGTNLKQFFPLPDDEKQQFRKEYFGDNADKFIITNVNRNQHRKDIPATIFGFLEYKAINPNAFLYLHMHYNDPLGNDLRAVMWQTNPKLEEGIDYMFPSDKHQNEGMPIDMLNKVYNASDVYLTTTRGEGWGLGVTEAMSTMLPVVCPYNTSLMEIGGQGKYVYYLWDQFPCVSRDDNIIRYQCDPIEIAEVLQVVYDKIKNNDQQHKEKIITAYNYVHTLTWENIAKKWAEIFKKVY